MASADVLLREKQRSKAREERWLSLRERALKNLNLLPPSAAASSSSLPSSSLAATTSNGRAIPDSLTSSIAPVGTYRPISATEEEEGEEGFDGLTLEEGDSGTFGRNVTGSGTAGGMEESMEGGWSDETIGPGKAVPGTTQPQGPESDDHVPLVRLLLRQRIVLTGK